MIDCLLYENSSASVCGAIWVISMIHSVVWNFDITLGCEVRFADEQNVYVLFFKEQNHFVFVSNKTVRIPERYSQKLSYYFSLLISVVSMLSTKLFCCISS